MKIKLLFAVAVLLYTGIAHAQSIQDLRSIEVNGKASCELIPDEVLIRVAYEEFYQGNKKVAIREIEDSIMGYLLRMNIDPKDISINACNARFGRAYKKKQEVMESREIFIRVTNLGLASELLDQLPGFDIQQMEIEQLRNFKTDSVVNTLKAAAVKDAEANAIALLTPLNLKLGKVLQISEDNYHYRGGDIMKREVVEYTKRQDLNFRKVYYSFGVIVLFEIE